MDDNIKHMEENIHKEPLATEKKMIEMGTWYAPLTIETLFSKYFSMVLFVALPFLGFWLGVEYTEKQNFIEQIKPAISDSIIIEKEFCEECDKCCESSLQIIKDGEYELRTSVTEQCKEGYSPNMLRCSTSLQWCEPERQVGHVSLIEQICGDIKFQNSKDNCYFEYAQSRKDESLCAYIENTKIRTQCVEYLISEEQEVILYTLGSEPAAISVGKQQLVTFTIGYAGVEEKVQMELCQIDSAGEIVKVLGILQDNGVDGDFTKNDYVYSGNFTIGPYDEEQVFSYRVDVEWNNGVEVEIATSEQYKLHVTTFPIGSRYFDSSNLVKSSDTDEKIVSDEVIIGFRDGVDPERIREIVNSIGGEVVGVLFGLNIYQVRIPDTVDGSGVHAATVRLVMYTEVEYAEPNFVTSFDN